MANTRFFWPRRCLATLAVLWALLGGTSAAAAQDLWGSRSLAMGGTLRAAPSGDAAVLMNPAGMSLTRAFQINGTYQWRASDSASMMNVSVVDSITTRVAAGLYYSFVRGTPSRTLALAAGGTFDLNETSTTHELGLALSYPIGKIIHIGVTNKYGRVEIEQPEGTPDPFKDGGGQGYTMDVGAVFTLIPNLNIAITGQNLVAIHPQHYPRLLGLGVSYALGTTFLAEFDSVLNFSAPDSPKASYHGGGELFLGSSYALRAGVMHDTYREATYVTGGLGLVSSKVGLDAALRQMVRGGAETTVALALRVFMN